MRLKWSSQMYSASNLNRSFAQAISSTTFSAERGRNVRRVSVLFRQKMQLNGQPRLVIIGYSASVSPTLSNSS